MPSILIKNECLFFYLRKQKTFFLINWFIFSIKTFDFYTFFFLSIFIFFKKSWFKLTKSRVSCNFKINKNNNKKLSLLFSNFNTFEKYNLFLNLYFLTLNISNSNYIFKNKTLTSLSSSFFITFLHKFFKNLIFFNFIKNYIRFNYFFFINFNSNFNSNFDFNNLKNFKSFFFMQIFDKNKDLIF
jgi:hypothetical protein